MKTKMLTALLLVQLTFSGCAECQNFGKHVHSTFTGLNRTITLYDANGHTIKEWHTQAKVEDKGGTCYFLDANGKAVTISGTFIIQEN